MLGWVGLALVMLGAVSVTAMALTASHGKVPPSKPLAVALHDAATAPPAAGVTAQFAIHQHLIPGSSTLLSTGPLADASGTVWAADGKVRLSIHSALGSTQLAYDGRSLSFFSSKNHAAYRLALGSHEHGTASSAGHAPPSVADISKLLTEVGNDAVLSGAIPGNIAGRPAYTVQVRSRHASGLVGSLALAWDATHGVPLRFAITPRGSDTPALELVVTHIRFGKLPPGATSLTLPPGTRTEALHLPSKQRLQRAAGHVHSATGARAVAKAVPFHVTAPPTLAGRPRTEVRSLGDGALVVYGHGLDSLLVFEKQAGDDSGMLPAMAPVSVNGAAGHELETTLGSILQFSTGRVTYTVAGFQTADTILSAAQSLP
ncbi:MAG TPA: hypothetical protein VGQ45_09755 [Gaiellales bacterium]|nr:hypothetical protein [Gaiellales bacterium]